VNRLYVGACLWLVSLAGGLGALGAPLSSAHAQATPAERAQAADAYDRGATAYRARDYAAAAQWFERANHALPSTVALVAAMRSHRSARNTQRAGTIALRLEGEPGLSGATATLVRQAIASARTRFVRIEVACSAACTLSVDGAPEEFTRFFATPNTDIAVVATFGAGDQTQHVTGRAGSVHTLAFDAPEGPADTVVAVEELPSEPEELALDEGENPYRISRRRFLSRPRATFFMTFVAASAVGGITTWSAVDARHSGQDLADAESTLSAEEIALIRAEHSRDVRRTHGYIGFTAVMVAMTGLVAGFTDWSPHGSAAPATEATVDVTAQGAELHILRRF
jgi:hypothetical protein